MEIHVPDNLLKASCFLFKIKFINITTADSLLSTLLVSRGVYEAVEVLTYFGSHGI